jgi:polysaccharide pyruvyl transferase WcaK-like protein
VNVEHTDTVAAFLRAAQQADVVVGSRLHALILAALAARPLVAVSYARKVEQLMTDLELGDYVLDVNSVQPEALTQLVRRAIAERDVLSLRLHSILARYQKELAAEYLNVVALVAERRVSQRSRT